jgi:C4-dicarboxylate-specific signal transduction histidine kinase
MFGGFLLVLATVWTVIVTDAVVESARTGGRTIVEFGRHVATPGVPQGIWVLAAMAASAAFAFAYSLGSVRERRVRRRVSVGLSEQWTNQTHREAGDEGRSRLLAWRLAELQTEISELTARREDLRRDVQEEEVREDRLTSVGLHRRSDKPVVVVPESPEHQPAAPSSEG